MIKINPNSVEMYIGSCKIKYMYIKDKKGEIKIRFAIFDVFFAFCIAFNQKRKVIPISKKPT